MTIAERLRNKGMMELVLLQGRLQGMQKGINLVLAVFDKFGQTTTLNNRIHD